MINHSLKKFYWFERQEGREGEREREREICCSTYLWIHWLLLTLTGYQTLTPGVSGQGSNQSSYPARAKTTLEEYRMNSPKPPSASPLFPKMPTLTPGALGRPGWNHPLNTPIWSIPPLKVIVWCQLCLILSRRHWPQANVDFLVTGLHCHILEKVFSAQSLSGSRPWGGVGLWMEPTVVLWVQVAIPNSLLCLGADV